MESSLDTVVCAANSIQELALLIIQRLRERIGKEPRPRATYRWQFHGESTFYLAAATVPYLNRLGISHVYASPYAKARSGSTHGYDIVDHTQFNPDLGGVDGFAVFSASLEANNMGHILDLVPNHMGVGSDENPWWQDVLENGPSSPFAMCFDIDWRPLKPDLDSKVLLPVLGDQFGKVLEDGQLQVSFADGSFSLRYFERTFPLAPRSFGLILSHRIDELEADPGRTREGFLEYQSILTAISHLPTREETDARKLVERHREKEVIKRRLARLCNEDRCIEQFILRNVQIFNGTCGQPASFDLLDALLQEQAYRLSFWRVAADEINYRRFFDVNELAAVCMERPDVFEKAHSLVLQLLKSGQVCGLRIDHADGLFDPTGYLWKLQEQRFLQLCHEVYHEIIDADPSSVAGNDSHDEWKLVETFLQDFFDSSRTITRCDPVIRPLYLLVEKILERSERLPDDWPVFGTSGYEFLNQMNQLFVDGSQAKAFDLLYSKFTGQKIDFSDLVCRSKKLIMKVSMSSELNVLGHQLDRISERRRSSRDFTRNGLTYALREVVSCFPVYRTYTTSCGVLGRDRFYVEQAVSQAKRQNPAISHAVFDFIRDVLLLAENEMLSDHERRERLQFIGRFQQFTGPMMAKSVEDTAFYRFNRLVSLNEVGGAPEFFGGNVDDFHSENRERSEVQPHAMLTTSTHDTKRSEDVRARINVLSENPREWKERLFRWTNLNRRLKVKIDGEQSPSRNDEYLLYQTLLGTWPFVAPHAEELSEYVTRIQRYMKKAIREAKVCSSWIAPNHSYEEATDAFVAAILIDNPFNEFREDFQEFADRISRLGMWNSLSQSTLKLTCPGVPDIYQGTETWNFSLVDPDNRRPVDFTTLNRMLDEIDQQLMDVSARGCVVDDMLNHATDGRIKLFVTAELLRLRRRLPELFTEAEYIPLTASGDYRSHIVAFARRWQSQAAIVVVPRLVASLLAPEQTSPIGEFVWRDTSILIPQWLRGVPLHNRFTGRQLIATESGQLPVAKVLHRFPVGVLSTICGDETIAE